VDRELNAEATEALSTKITELRDKLEEALAKDGESEAERQQRAEIESILMEIEAIVVGPLP
jgi:hypothetical protein